MMNFTVDLFGRVALVTGAGSGIGYAIANELGRAGRQVLINDLAPEWAEAAARDIPNAEPVPGNIVEAEFAGRMCERPIDILVNNAGFQHVAPIEEFSVEVYRRLMDVFLVGPFLLCQAVTPGMKERCFGRIINSSSIHGKLASPFKAGYVSGKHGILGLTRVLALETAAYGTTMSATCPGWVDTPLVRNQLGALASQHDLPVERVLGSKRLTSYGMICTVNLNKWPRLEGIDATVPRPFAFLMYPNGRMRQILDATESIA